MYFAQSSRVSIVGGFVSSIFFAKKRTACCAVIFWKTGPYRLRVFMVSTTKLRYVFASKSALDIGAKPSLYNGAIEVGPTPH